MSVRTVYGVRLDILRVLCIRHDFWNHMFKQNLKMRKDGHKKLSLDRKGTIVQKVFLKNV